MSPLFLDVSALTASNTDRCLELMYKSHHDDDGGIWAPHDSPLIQHLIELFTQRGLDRLAAVQSQLLAWLAGDNYQPNTPKPAKPDEHPRWSNAEQQLVKLYLENLPPEQWDLDDHMLAVEYVTQRYLPPNELLKEADWLASKAVAMGKVQAHLEQVSLEQADSLLAAIPNSAAEVKALYNLPAVQARVLDFAKARCAENVQALADSTRHAMRSLILQHLTEQQAGTAQESLQTKLLDRFAMLNRDWRRIAVTEAGEAQTQGYIASLKPGAKVRRVEQYANACTFCHQINGVVATVVDPAAKIKDPKTQIWAGKNNIGRSASPMKRVGNVLVKRPESEMWWLPAGLVHPHCRGRWVPVSEPQPDDNPEFAAWLNAHLGSK